MNNYKVLETFELDGVVYEVGSEVELTDEQYSNLVGKVVSVDASMDVPAEEIPTSTDTPVEGVPAENELG